jgi:hypothetical protein
MEHLRKRGPATLLAMATVMRLGATQRVKLEWEPSWDSMVTGYKVYCREATSTNLLVADAGKATTFTITNLLEASTYGFYVTAYTDDGLESDPSNTLEATMPLGPLDMDLAADEEGRSVLTVRLEAVAGRQVALQSSTNLIDWTTLATSEQGQPLACRMTNSPGEGHRFFRSQSLP